MSADGANNLDADQNKNMRFFDDISEIYDSVGTVEDGGWLGPMVAFGLTYRYATSGQTILDLGVGTGFGADFFHRAGFSVIGVDFSAKMLAVCARKGVCIECIQHDLRNTPYPVSSGVPDHVVSSGAFCFVENMEIPIKEVARILKPGGIFCFDTLSDLEAGAVPKYSGSRFHKRNSDIVRLLVENGFELLTVLPYFSPRALNMVDAPLAQHFTMFVARKIQA